MSLFPGWSWFITASGGPYAHPRSLGTLLMEAPLLAHSWGAWLTIAFLKVAGVPFGFRMWWIVQGIAVLWQALNYERGAYGTEPAPVLREIGWRELIAAAASLPVVWL